MIYQTRHMVALREFAHFDKSLTHGDEFACQPIDADYYLSHGMARLDATKGEAPAAEQEPTTAPPVLTNRRGRRSLAPAPGPIAAKPVTKSTLEPAETQEPVSGFVSAADACADQ